VKRKTEILQGSHTGLLFNIQRFSLHDGPGIRTTVFLKGCPLKCKWCSNPESANEYPEIMTNDRKCIKCGLCIDICYQKAISFVGDNRQINWQKCNRCLKCAEVCPSGAIELVGKYMSCEEVVSEIEKDKPFYLNSGGGVTISGGEPLRQWKFVRELCNICRKKGIHVALDTSGYAQWNDFEQVVEHVDLVLYDLKHLNPEKHKEGTGIDNEIILENAAKVADRKTTWFRIPLIPDFNDSTYHMREVVLFAMKLKIKRISLLPYHRFGVPKYNRIGREYDFNNNKNISEDLIAEFTNMIQAEGLEAKMGS